MSKNMKIKKGLEMADENLENVGGGWWILYREHGMNGIGGGYHIIDRDGIKVGNTTYSLEDAYKEAERLGLRPEDEKSEKEEPLNSNWGRGACTPDWWRKQRENPRVGDIWF